MSHWAARSDHQRCSGQLRQCRSDSQSADHVVCGHFQWPVRQRPLAGCLGPLEPCDRGLAGSVCADVDASTRACAQRASTRTIRSWKPKPHQARSDRRRVVRADGAVSAVIGNFYLSARRREQPGFVAEFVNGSSFELDRADAPFSRPGTWHRLRLEVLGNALRGYVDGQLHPRSARSVARGGHRAGLTTFRTAAQFDDAHVDAALGGGPLARVNARRKAPVRSQYVSEPASFILHTACPFGSGRPVEPGARLVASSDP